MYADSPTMKTYTTIQVAYDFFNERLFEGRLPQALCTLRTMRNARGYFWANQFQGKEKNAAIDEIALNPETFKDRSDKDVFSTLVHEMCHLEQEHFGKPSRSGYHNKEWASMMKRVGLQPSTTGQEGGIRS